MDSAAPIGGTRRGFSRWRRTIPALFGLPVLVFLLGNLVLSSGVSCRWIAGKIQHRTGLGMIPASGIEVTPNLTPLPDWTHPLLSLKPLETKIGGYQFLVAAKICALTSLPLQIEVQLPGQPLAAFKIPFNGQAAAESIVGNLRVRRLRPAPATRQGDLVVETASPNIHVAGQETKFDMGRAVMVQRGGLLSCVNARLISDELSVLGNATLLADGRAAGVVRLVAAPESVAAIASRVSPNIPGTASLTPLATPQRAAFDVESFGTIGQLFLRLGQDGPIVNLHP